MRVVSIDPQTNIVQVRDKWDGPVIRTLTYDEYMIEEEAEIERIIDNMPEGPEKEEARSFCEYTKNFLKELESTEV